MEILKVKDVKRGLHTVDKSWHPRKYFHLVKDNVIKALSKTKALPNLKQHGTKDYIGSQIIQRQILGTCQT